MSARFSGLQTALQAAAHALGGNGEEFGLDEVLDEVRLHNATLLDGMSEAEGLAAVTMTLEGQRIPDGGVGWMALGFVASTRGYTPEETAMQRWSRIMKTHREAGDMRLGELEEFQAWTKAYVAEQDRQMAEIECHISVMQDTGAPTLGKAIEQTAASIIERAKGAAP